jgi:Holliday junction DNA helicase RuvB
VSHLRIVLGAAASRGELPDHMLFSGPPGLGKTTLAQIIARECGVELVTTSGPAIERPGDLAALLSGVQRPSVVFIDEIHRMPRTVEEILYPAMEDGMLDFIVGEGVKARSVRLPLAAMCIVGATTQMGMLSAPLRDRFGFVARMQLYGRDDLSAIVRRSADLLGSAIDGDAAGVVASRSRGTPRVANMLLRRVRDWAQFNDVATVDAATAGAALDAFGVDALGLDRLGLDILTALCTTFRGGPVGVTTLAAAVGEAPQTLSEVYEPYLMHCGLLARTPRGRMATPEAFEHLNLAVPASMAAPQTGGEAPLLEFPE